MDLEEVELIKRAMERDENASQELFDRHRKRLSEYLYILAANSSLDPLDLFQDTWVLALTKLQEGHFDAQRYSLFYPWLMRLAHNIFIDALRKARRQIRLVSNEQIDFFLESTIDLDADVAEAIELRELQEILDNAILSLSDRHREVLLLSRDGLTPKEIAKVLRLSEGSVRARLHRARKKLKEILECNDAVKAYLIDRRVRNE